MGEAKRRKQLDPNYGQSSQQFSITHWLRENRNKNYPLFLKSLLMSVELKGQNIYDIININTASRMNIGEQIPEIKKASADGKPISSLIADSLGKSNPISDIFNLLENQNSDHQTFRLTYKGKAHFLTWTDTQIHELIKQITAHSQRKS